jgi:hypothetical protein
VGIDLTVHIYIPGYGSFVATKKNQKIEHHTALVGPSMRTWLAVNIVDAIIAATIEHIIVGNFIALEPL